MELLNLTWDVYSENSSNTIRNLYHDTAFTDITLLTEDDRQISAHKVVLASSSCFFRRILMKNFHQNPLIYLKGIKFSDLSSIMKFIYLGQTEINRNEVENFMRTGRDLEISGLLDLKTSQTNLNKKKRVHFKLENGTEEVATPNNETDMSIESDLESSIEDTDLKSGRNESLVEGDGDGKSGVERYDCSTCNQSYSRQDNLFRHKSLAHGELLL